MTTAQNTLNIEINDIVKMTFSPHDWRIVSTHKTAGVRYYQIKHEGHSHAPIMTRADNIVKIVHKSPKLGDVVSLRRDACLHYDPNTMWEIITFTERRNELAFGLKDTATGKLFPYYRGIGDLYARQ